MTTFAYIIDIWNIAVYTTSKNTKKIFLNDNNLKLILITIVKLEYLQHLL